MLLHSSFPFVFIKVSAPALNGFACGLFSLAAAADVKEFVSGLLQMFRRTRNVRGSTIFYGA